MMSLDKMWNIRRPSPPDNIVKVDINPGIIGGVEKCIQVLANAVDVLNDQHALGSDMFVLSRFLLRRKAQIRRHKIKQVLTQVETCLKRYEETDLGGVMKTMHHHFQQAKMKQQTGSIVCLPSCGMFEYILVRLIGVTALMAQTVNYCVNATFILETDVKLAHLLPTTMMCLATISRIWACCRSLYLDCASWYESLLPILELLPQRQDMSLDDLPKDLLSWLGQKICLENMCSVDSAAGMENPGLKTQEEPEEEPLIETRPTLKRGLDEDIGAPVKIARKDLGIKLETKSPKKSKKKKVKKMLTKESSVTETSSASTIKMEEDTSDTEFTPFSMHNIKTEPDVSDESMTSDQPFCIQNIKTEPDISDEDLMSVQPVSKQNIKTEPDIPDEELTSYTQNIKTEPDIPDEELTSYTQNIRTEPDIPDEELICEQHVSRQNIKTESVRKNDKPDSTRKIIRTKCDTDLTNVKPVSKQKCRTVKVKKSDKLVSKQKIKTECENSDYNLAEDVSIQNMRINPNVSDEDVMGDQSVSKQKLKTEKVKKTHLVVSKENIKREPDISDTGHTSQKQVSTRKVEKRNLEQSNHSVSKQNVKTELDISDEDLSDEPLKKQKVKKERVSKQNVKRETDISDEDLTSDQPVLKRKIKTEKSRSEKHSGHSDSSLTHFIKCDPSMSNSNVNNGLSSAHQLKTEHNNSVRDQSTDQLFPTHSIKTEHCPPNNDVTHVSSVSTHCVKKEADISSQSDEHHSQSHTNMYHIENMKQLKQEISNTESFETLMDIFLFLKPNNASESTVWDEWPRISYLDKQELFEMKLEIIQKLRSKSIKSRSAKNELLAKSKKHCFTYLQEVKKTSSKGVAEMMNFDTINSLVQELGSGQVTWLGSTIKMTPLEAQVFQLDLKSLLRKMSKVKVTNTTRFTALQNEAGQLVTRRLRQAARNPTEELKSERSENDVDRGGDYGHSSMTPLKSEPATSDDNVNNIPSSTHYLKTEQDSSVRDGTMNQSFQAHSIKTENGVADRGVSNRPSVSANGVKKEEDVSSPSAASASLSDTHMHHVDSVKQLKQEISNTENIETLMDIFLSWKPTKASESTIWDEWPRINYLKKQELFEMKLQFIQKLRSKIIKSGSAKNELAKSKKHCFSYLQEVVKTNRSGVAEMMNFDTINSLVQELCSGQVTWLGSTIKVTPLEAQVFQLELESVLRKMTKVKVTNKARFSALQDEAGQLVMRHLRRGTRSQRD